MRETEESLLWFAHERAPARSDEQKIFIIEEMKAQHHNVATKQGSCFREISTVGETFWDRIA